MSDINANLNRRDPGDVVVPWLLNTDAENPTAGAALSDPVVEHGLRARLGAIADAVWSGSGSGSIIAILKAVWTRLGDGSTKTQILGGIQLEATGSAGVVNADAIGATEVSPYRWISLQITGTWVGTITFQGSNDNSAWVSVGLVPISSTLTSAAVTTTGNGLWAGPVNFKFFRARMTSYTSGTATGRAEFATSPSAVQTIGVLGSVDGRVSHDAVDSGAPVKIGGKANSAAPTAVTAADRVDAWYDLRGQAVVELRDSTGTEVGTAAAPVRTDPTGTTTQPVSGSVGVNNLPPAPLTDAQLRASSVPVIGPLTNTELRAAAVPVSQTTLPENIQPAKTLAASLAGNTAVHTPAPGKKIRLYYYNLGAAAGNTAAVAASLRFAATGTDFVKVSLLAGAMFARNVGAGRRYLEGAVNEALVVNLATAQTVNLNIEYDEI